MKHTSKIIITLIILISTTLPAEAQFGIKGGINFPNVTAKSRYNNFKIEPQDKIGFNIGAFLDVGNAGNLEVTSSLSYVRKQISGRFGFVNPSTSDMAEMSVDYLVYSLIGKFNVFEMQKLTPYIYFAPRFNVYLSNNYEQEVQEVPQSTRNVISNNLTKFGFGVSLGVGTSINTGSRVTPFFEAQFSPDFFNAYDDGYITFKSNSFELLAGIRIGK